MTAVAGFHRASPSTSLDKTIFDFYHYSTIDKMTAKVLLRRPFINLREGHLIYDRPTFKGKDSGITPFWNMEPQVILIDQYETFTLRASERLNDVADRHYRTSCLSSDIALLEKDDSPLKQASVLILPSQWKTHPNIANQTFDSSILFWDEQEGPPLRFIGIRELDRTIQNALEGHRSEAAPPKIIRHMGCHLSFSEEVSRRLTRQVIKQEMSLGHRLVYLPIKPLYRMEDSFQRGPKQTLGELLCQLALGDIPEAKSVGEWLYLHESGYFTFRLPDRADDLIAADMNAVKKLIHLLHEYAQSSSEITTVWLDTEGMYLDRLLQIAKLCDHLYMDVPKGESSAAEVARRELSILMAQLPATCAILELPE